jgi:hypothetical protein
MGFYIRKSVNLGGVRLNLSKSGIGVSTGVKGFRLGMNGRGTYVHMGRGGLYYRRQLSWSRPKARKSSSLSTLEPTNPGVFYTENLAQPLDISSGLADIDQVLDHFRTKAGPVWISWSLGIGAVISIFISVVIATIFAVACLASIAIIKNKKSGQILIYNLDDESETRFSNLVESIDEYFSASKLWLYEQASATFDLKRNAGASTLIKRRPAFAYTEGEKSVRSNVSIPTLSSGKDRIFFLPDMVVCANGDAISAFSYDCISFSDNLTRFVEDDAVPPDAQIVDQTWKFTNKNGGPDRRFNNNKVLPVCLYQQATWTFGSSYRRTLTKSKVVESSRLIKTFSDLMAIHLKATVVQNNPMPNTSVEVPQLTVASERDGSRPSESNLVPVATPIIGSSAMTAPFGIEFHLNISELNVLNRFPNNTFVVEAPAPHPLFKTYLVRTNSQEEVVWIKGVGEIVENDAYGAVIQGIVDRVADQLSQRYGRGQKTDSVNYGSIWGEDPQYWMHGLADNQRHFFHLWERPAAGSLPEDVHSIFLAAIAIDAYSSNAVLEYASPKLAAAEAEAEQGMANFL